MITGIIIYLSIVLLTLFLIKINIRKKYIVLIFILFLLSAFRFDVGNDFLNYYRLSYYDRGYEWVTTQPYENIYYFYYLLAYFFNEPLIFFVFTSLTICVLLLILCRQYKEYGIYLILLFIISGMFFFSMNQIRQCLSVMVLLTGIKYFINGNKFKFILTFVLSILFHTSMIFISPIIILIIIFENKIKNLKRINLILIIIISLLFRYLVAQNIFEIILEIDFFADYKGWMLKEGINLTLNQWVMAIAINLLFIYILLTIKKESFKRKEINTLIFLFFIGLVIRNVSMPFADRISIYFTYTRIILIAIIIKDDNVFKSSLYKKILYIYLTIIFIGYIITDGHGVMIYKIIGG